MPQTPDMEAFTDRVLEIVRNILFKHRNINSQKSLAEFMNKYYFTTDILISKWKKRSQYPTIQHALVLNKFFKEYGATGSYLIEGKRAGEKTITELDKRISAIESSLNKGKFKGNNR